MATKRSDQGPGGRGPAAGGAGDLSAWLETPLAELAARTPEAYRFTVSEPTAGERMTILVVVGEDGTARLLAEHRPPEGDLVRFEERLSADDVELLRAETAAQGVWAPQDDAAAAAADEDEDDEDEDDEGGDETWLIERIAGGEQRSATQRPPGSAELRALGELFLELAGLVGGDEAIFDPESEENHEALELLGELLVELGYRSQPEAGEERTLRVGLAGRPYPLLEPGFEPSGEGAGLPDHEEALVLDVWGAADDADLGRRLAAAPMPSGVTFAPGSGETSGGARHAGWFLVPLSGDDEGFLDFEAFREPLAAIRGLLEAHA